MAGTAVTPAPVPWMLLNGGGGPPNTILKDPDPNRHISAVIDRLSLHLLGDRKVDRREFLNLCLSLARNIDFSIANHMVPSRFPELPLLVKQVCRNRNDSFLQAAIMVLMISVKSACQTGWFSDGDSEELSNLAKEIATSFCSVSNFNTEPSCSLSVISTIMSRFYPRMKMGHIFAFLEVKPGYDAYVRDFQISKDIKSFPGDKIRLFVAQTDNIETSSCLVSPAKVNFLLNGRGVEMRTNLSVDTGPQIPTFVSNLKYGSNLLQAVGEFNGNYIIAVAVMSEVPNPDINTLQDYEQHAPATEDSDAEIIMGSSRISLNCPISFKKIKTPVKGHSCKHFQCFDFDNYVDINSRRPSWRCPHCNQHVCFTDIRIDQKMVKVLKEVGPNVSDVTISSDGSWNAVTESDDTLQKPEDTTFNTGRDESPQPSDILDLTQIDDVMEDVVAYETDDRKLVRNAHSDVNQSNSHVPDDFWSGIYLSTFGMGSSNVRPNAQVTSVLTDSLTSPVSEGALGTIAVPQNGTSLPNTLQLQQYQFGNPPITNEYGRFPSLPRNVTRTPIAVQALPAQTPTPHLQRSYSANTFTPNGRSPASQASPAALNSSSTFRANPRQGPPISSASLPQHSAIQQNRSYPSARPPQQNAGFHGPNQVPTTFRVPNERQSSSQQTATVRMPQATSQSPNPIQSSTQPSGTFLRPQITQQSQLFAAEIAAANRAVQMSFDPSRISPSFPRTPDGRNVTSPGDQRGNLGHASQPVPVTDGYDPTAEMNWRPAGRMRGALSGQAYTDAWNQFMNRPNQQVQAARPNANVSSVPTNVPPQAYTVWGTPAPNYPSAGPVSSPVDPDVLPGGSAGTS